MNMISRLVVLVLLAFTVPAAAESGKFVDIERVTSPGGIHAWLVTDPSIPVVSVRFAFRGGAALDPALRQHLTRELAPEIARIEATLGRTIEAWRPD